MALSLRIENETSLPDGGPLSVNISGRRSLDIGRDQHLDWTLPDTTRYISGKHCEVRFQNGAYWLYDLSTNGTFINGSQTRMQSPYRLRNNDRLTIGHYIIQVTVDEEPGQFPNPGPSAMQGGAAELWTPEPDAAPPVAARELQSARELPAAHPDFLDWAADVPSAFTPAHSAYSAPPPAAGFGSRVDPFAPAAPHNPPPPPAPSYPQAHDEYSWAPQAPAMPPPQEPAARVPSPRRPVRGPDPGSPWNAEPGFGTTGAQVLRQPAEAEGRESPAYEAVAGAPSRPTAPPAFAPAANGPSADLNAGLRELAAGAGIAAAGLQSKSAEQLARDLGGLLRLVVDNMRQLLQARLQAKRAARLSSHTTVQAIDNNPLKFAPTSEDALRIMLGPPTTSYLDAAQALEQGFRDIKSHEVKTFSAMQNALIMLMQDLDPTRAGDDAAGDRGLTSLISSRKAKMWDVYIARWKAKTGGTDAGLVEAFMRHFAECYERGQP